MAIYSWFTSLKMVIFHNCCHNYMLNYQRVPVKHGDFPVRSSRFSSPEGHQSWVQPPAAVAKTGIEPAEPKQNWDWSNKQLDFFFFTCWIYHDISTFWYKKPTETNRNQQKPTETTFWYIHSSVGMPRTLACLALWWCPSVGVSVASRGDLEMVFFLPTSMSTFTGVYPAW